MSSDLVPSLSSTPTATEPESQPRQRATHNRADVTSSVQWKIDQPTLGILFFIVLLAGAGLRLYQLGAESFSYDEGIMIEATSSGWAIVMENITRGRPPLIVLLGFGWIQLVGESEFAVRLLPALMGIVSIGMIFRIGQVLINDTVGLLAAAVLSISAFHLFHSQDYRYYSLLTLMTLFSTYFYVRCFVLAAAQPAVVESGEESTTPDNERWQRRQWIEWGGYVLFSAFVYYAHYQGVFALVAQGLFILSIWMRLSNKRRLRWFISQVAIGLLLLPSFLRVLLDFTAGSADGDFQGTIGALGNLGPLSDPPFWLPFHTLLIKFNFISVGIFREWPILLATGLLLLIGIVLAYRQRKRRSQSLLGAIPFGSLPWLPIRFLLLWALCPVFIPFILSKLLSPMYLPRYTISALPAVCLLIALLFITMHRLIPLWSSLGALLILSAPGIANYYEHDFKEQWQVAAETVREFSDPMAEGVTERDSARFIFASVNNETADRIQLLFGRYFMPDDELRSANSEIPPDGTTVLMETSCALSVGLMPAEALPAELANCFGEDAVANDRVWMITRTAKEGPQLVVRDRLLSNIPDRWEQIYEEQFSGVVARLYRANPE